MVTEAPAEDGDQAGVLFHREDAGAGVEEVFRQGAQSGADFEDLVAGGGVGEGHDAAELVAIVEEVLAERPREAEVFRGQEVAHLAERHVSPL
jgi:Asp-tRNA(Asn)/Glu-tRNA(Gln) amidotransferase B subunit